MAEKKKSAPVSTGPVKPEDKKKALETALAQIEKNFGKGAIMRLGDDSPVNVEAISTGSLSLDLALGIGGVPRGRIVEIYGPESSGKTTLALHILASAQKKGGEVAFIDVEHALEPAYARALGVNTIRLAHYPQNEYIVRKAEQMGFMLWEEIPVWQSIDFTNDVTMGKARTMFDEMLQRDKNRCAVSMWGVANETRPSEARNAFLTRLVSDGRAKDNTRLYVAAFDIVYYQRDKDLFTMEDSFPEQLDLIGVNKYMGWYAPWPKDPKDCHWQVCPDKPLLITEFGGEALYGQFGDETVASSWSEDYQAKLYRDNIRMFENIPNLCGVSPWILFDFRSPFRFHPTNQDGWNRKGLVSDQGMRKKAWYIMRDYYRSKAK